MNEDKIVRPPTVRYRPALHGHLRLLDDVLQHPPLGFSDQTHGSVADREDSNQSTASEDGDGAKRHTMINRMA